MYYLNYYTVLEKKSIIYYKCRLDICHNRESNIKLTTKLNEISSNRFTDLFNLGFEQVVS